MNTKVSASKLVIFTSGIVLMPTLYKQLAQAVGWLLHLIPPQGHLTSVMVIPFQCPLSTEQRG